VSDTDDDADLGAAPAPDAPPRPRTDAPSLVARAREIGVELSEEQATQLLAFLDRVLEINLSLNLTSIRDREDAVVRHILDSLSVIPVWREISGKDAPRRFLDLGTGGGFPGAALAAAWPASQALLIDSTGKKVRAVADALLVAPIRNAEAFQARGYMLARLRPETHHSFDLVVARAVGKAEEIVREVAPLLTRGGIVLAMKGSAPPEDEVAAGDREALRCGLEPAAAHRTTVPGLDRRTILVWRRPRR
jgi:16S rRNA (guanine527-N7)-methyltransferase